MTGVILPKGEFRHGSAHRENGMQNKDWGDASTSQEMTKIASKPPTAREEAQNRFPLTAPEGTNSADTLILGFWPPEV